MLVKDFVNSCSIGTEVEVVLLKDGETSSSEVQRGSNCIICKTKNYLDIYELEILFFKATGKDKISVYCGDWK